jgi:hypothetical protein
MSWAKIKRGQANDADRLAAVASGIGEYGISNACYRLAGLLRQQAAAEQEAEKARAEWEGMTDDRDSGGTGALRRDDTSTRYRMARG